MTDSRWSILFDLDQTLILTDALEPLRQARMWQQVYRRFHLTALPPGTMDFLRQARRMARLGIVTNTPRPYAEKLVAYHALAQTLPVLVAYHDTKCHKPDPAPLLKAVEQLGCSPDRCFYIGDRTDDLVAAIGAQVIPIALAWNNTLERTWEARLGRSICLNWGDVLTAITQMIDAVEDT